MKRFLVALSSAYLCAAAANTAWAQIPGPQSSTPLLPSTTMPKEVPIVAPAQAVQQSGTPITLRAVESVRGKAMGAGPILGNNNQPSVNAGIGRILPPIVDAKALVPPVVDAKTLGKSSLLPSPLTAPAASPSPPTGNPSNQATSSRSTTAFGMQMKAEHPDISLPTEVPIVRSESNASPIAKSVPQVEANSAKTEAELPSSEPVIISGSSKSSAARVKEINVPVVSTAELEAVNSAKEESGLPPKEEEQETFRQDSQLPAIVRPEMALPPIKPGEEFPRTPKNIPIVGPSAVKPQVDSKITAPSKQVSVESAANLEFVPAPVGNGTTLKQDAIVQPAAPLLEQDMSGSIPGHAHAHGAHDQYGSQADWISPEGSSSSPIGQSYLDSHSHDGCEQCGGAGCSHCGLGGWNALGNRGGIALGGGCDNGCFGLLPCAQNYFIADVLYWTRNGGNVIGTDFGGLYDYDWNFGGQVTMGTRVDPLYGHELTYFGLFELDAGNTDVSPAGEIDALFVPGGSLGYGDTSAFFDATEVTQTANSRLHSFQVNRVRLGWDVVQSHLGLRYIWFEDEYQMQSRNLFGDTGLLSLNASNNLIGPEVGVKLFYDVGRRISFSTHWKLGGYLNAYRSETFVQNNGVTKVNNSDSGTGFAASFDIGANAHIHITQRMRLRGGYGLLWLWDVASVTGNFPSTLTTASGTSTNDSEDVIFHGLNLGFEYYW